MAFRDERCVTAGPIHAVRIPEEPEDKVRVLEWIYPIMAHCPLDFVYIFTEHLDADALTASLKTALGHYPVLAGRCVPHKAEISLNNAGVPFTLLSMPGRASELLEEIERGKYTDIRDAESVLAGDDALLSVQLTLFDGGDCSLGISMNHLVCDGACFGMFMEDWSKLHNGEQIEPVHVDLPQHMHCTLSEFEASTTASQMEFQAVLGGEDFTKAIDAMAKGVAQKLSAPPARTRLHVTSDELRRLKSAAEKEAGSWVSTNEALVRHVLVICLDTAGIPFENRKCSGFESAVSLRKKVSDVPSRTFARLVTYASCPVDMTDSAAAIQQIHNTLRAEITEERLLNVWRLNISALALKTMYASSKLNKRAPGVIAHWNNQSANPYYNIDFGAGKPLRGIPWNIADGVKVVPVAGGDGVDIFISHGAGLTAPGLDSWVQGFDEHSFFSNLKTAHHERLERI